MYSVLNKLSEYIYTFTYQKVLLLLTKIVENLEGILKWKITKYEFDTFVQYYQNPASRCLLIQWNLEN